MSQKLYANLNMTISDDSSHVFATESNTATAGGDSYAVRADLGCFPGVGSDVDNHLAFNVMDRYSAPSVGL
jgi:hypothetical protein